VQAVDNVQAVTLAKTASKKPAASIIIEDWQLSGKYKRRPIYQEEIDFINVNFFHYMYSTTISVTRSLCFNREEVPSDLFTRH
jgi:hypothetical protein